MIQLKELEKQGKKNQNEKRERNNKKQSINKIETKKQKKEQ